MKLFLAGLYTLFLVAMASGIYFAYNNAEGVVETSYYEKGNGWFHAKAEEQRAELAVSRPGPLGLGSNDIRLAINTHGRPLEQADVHLFVGNVSTSRHDTMIPMRETAPGVYQTTALIPARGKWLVRMELASPQLKTSRSWFIDID